MTLRTSRVDMRPAQRECGLGMVKCDRGPACGRMASRAVRPKLTVVFILGSVAGIAILGCALVNSIHVARKAGHCAVFAN